MFIYMYVHVVTASSCQKQSQVNIVPSLCAVVVGIIGFFVVNLYLEF